MKREIIEIDKEKCTGCGDCVSSCPEGAIQMIDGKARLVNEAFCDGLGACISDCPEDAIKIEEREAEPYDEKAVVDKMLDQGEEVLKAHLEHLEDHGQEDLLEEAFEELERKEVDINREDLNDEQEEEFKCPGAEVRDIEQKSDFNASEEVPSRLEQWPVQLRLVPPQAPFLDGSNLLIAADCVPFAYGNFHNDFLTEDDSLVVGCPKFDDSEYYLEKLENMFNQNDIEKVKIVRMEVPCCSGLVNIAKQAAKNSNKDLELEEIIIGIKGNRKE